MVVPLPGQALRPRAALFGKLPAHGDFVSRALDEAAVTAWDAFFAKGVAEAREALGDDFEAAHDAAPPWRFVQGPGAFGAGWRAGAWAPSMDRAGRRFVIALLAEGAASEAVAEAMEAAIYDGFEAGENADDLLNRAEAAIEAAASAAAPAPRTSRWWTLGGADHRPDQVEGEPNPGLLSRALRPAEAEVAQ